VGVAEESEDADGGGDDAMGDADVTTEALQQGDGDKDAETDTVVVDDNDDETLPEVVDV
jgi:hypothetical protein